MKADAVQALSPPQNPHRPQWVEQGRTRGAIPVYGANADLTGEVLPAAFRPASETAEINLSNNPKENGDQEGFSFFDLLDIINPFQHIPLVNLAYRKLTGDAIKPISSIIGGGVFGGPFGAVNGIVNAVVEDATGKDVLENVVSFAGLSKDQPAAHFSYERETSIEEEITAYEDLPASLLAFAQKPLPKV